MQHLDSLNPTATPTTPAISTPRRVRGLQLQISERRLLLLFGDALACLLAVLIALYAWSLAAKEAFDGAFIGPRLYWFGVLPVMWLFVARANDFYDLRLNARLGASLARLGLISVQFFVAYLLVFFLVSGETALPRLFALYFAVAAAVLAGGWRVARPFLIGWSAGRRRALIVGGGSPAATILEALRTEAAGEYEVMGRVGSTGEGESESPAGLKVLGTGADLPALVAQYHISELIIAYGHELPGDVFQGVMACYEQGLTIVPMPLLYEQITGRVPVEHVGTAHWAVVLPLTGRTLALRLNGLVKRAVDVLLAVIGLALFALLLPPLALIMHFDSPGPIFFRQVRLGRGGRPFKIIKLRSMIVDAEKITGAVWATKGDPRITRVGRFLRKSRLDEVPQLWNVLRGEMSIVGPRPERPEFVAQLTAQIPFYRTRLLVAPGLTGWAQVRYKYGNSAEDALIKLQYDLYYIRHQSLGLDMLIMMRTLGKMLLMRGT